MPPRRTRPRRPALPSTDAAARAFALAAAFTLAAGAVRAQQPATPGRTPPATAAAGHALLHGIVYDSLTRAPLRGATVQLVRPDNPSVSQLATTDSAGAFRIDSVAPGTYVIGFLHPMLDLLDIAVSPRRVEVAPNDGRLGVDLAVPALPRVVPVLCGSAMAPTDSSGLLAGRVHDADSELPVPNATVVLTWSELVLDARGVRTERRRVPVTTNETGRYVICGAPGGDGLTASAAAPGRASGLVDLTVPFRGLLVRDLALGDSVAAPPAATTAAAPPAPGAPADTGAARPPGAARGTARVAGVVLDPGGRPVRGARVFVVGAASAAVSGERGAFALDALPSGTRTLEARAIGFQPRRMAVDLARGRTTTVDVRLATAVATLDRVVVMGKASRRTRMIDEFLERKRRGAFGRFITAEQIERTGPIAVTDALRMTPGVRVVPTGGFGNAIRGRGNCAPAVVLDGMPVADGDREIDTLVSPQQVAGIEVYLDAGSAPIQYGGARANGCGVVLFWTKR